MVNGCGFTACDKAGEAKRNSPAAMLNKYICEVGLIFVSLLII
jgi:hypothetical protein